MNLAVVTKQERFAALLADCFDAATDSVEHFSEDHQLIRTLSRKAFSAIIVDASDVLKIDIERPVFASRSTLTAAREPLIVVGTFSDAASIDQALEAGADDFVRYPVSLAELRARTCLAVRRSRLVEDQPVLTVGPYRLERQSSLVSFAGREVSLTPREFALAWMLFAQHGEYVAKPHIAAAIWGSDNNTADRTIEQYVYRLRKKLCLTGAHDVKLGTRYSHGYRIEVLPRVRAVRSVHVADCVALPATFI